MIFLSLRKVPYCRLPFLAALQTIMYVKSFHFLSAITRRTSNRDEGAITILFVYIRFSCLDVQIKWKTWFKFRKFLYICVFHGQSQTFASNGIRARKVSTALRQSSWGNGFPEAGEVRDFNKQRQSKSIRHSYQICAGGDSQLNLEKMFKTNSEGAWVNVFIDTKFYKGKHCLKKNEQILN